MARNLDHVLEQLLEISASWQQLAPSDSFAGMTLAEFQAATAQSKTRRHEVMALFAELAAKRKERAEADAATKVLVDLVIHSIKGSPQHGSDSALYCSLGYVPQSERKTGMTRRKGKSAAKV